MKRTLMAIFAVAVLLYLQGCSGNANKKKILEESPLISSCRNHSGYSIASYINVERPFIIVRTKSIDTEGIGLISYSEKNDLSEKEFKKIRTVILAEDKYVTSIAYGREGKKTTELKYYATKVTYFDVLTKKYMERLLQDETPVPTSIKGGGIRSVSDEDIVKSVRMKANGSEKFAHDGELGALVFSPDGKLLISGDSYGVIKFWSMPDGALLKTIGETKIPLNQGFREIRSLAVSPDGNMLVSCSFDGTIKFWNLPDGELIKTIDFEVTEKNKQKRMLSVAIRADGKTLASSSYENDIKLWNLPDGELVTTLKLGNYSGSLAFSPDGTLLVSRGDDAETIQLWSMPEAARRTSWKAPYVNKICISPNGKWLISGSEGTITIWELPEGKQVKTIRMGGSWVESLAVSPDSKTLIAGDIEKRIILWNLPEGDKMSVVERGEEIIYRIATSPDGTVFASGKSKGSLQIWSLPEGKLVTRLWDRSSSPDY